MSDSDVDCTYWGCSDEDYTRWIILAVVLVAICVVFVIVWFWSMRRAQRGFPIAGTLWMLPAAVTNNHDGPNGRPRGRNGSGGRQRRDEEADPVPTYHAELGEDDAGYYDPSGNYVAHEPPPYIEPPPKAVLPHAEEQEYEMDELSDRPSSRR